MLSPDFGREISQEVQEQFVATRMNWPRRRVNPESLFEAAETRGGEIFRNYYSDNMQVAGGAWFSNIKGKYFPTSIRISVGEDPIPHHNLTINIVLPDNGTRNAAFYGIQNNSYFHIQYDGDGFAQEIKMSKDGRVFIEVPYPISNKTNVMVQSDLTFGGSTDQVVFPQIIYPMAMPKLFFPGEYLSDPFAATEEDDDSWHRPDVLELAGITWRTGIVQS